MDVEEWDDPSDPASLTVQLENGARKLIRVGTTVLVRDGDNDCYGAIVRDIKGKSILLTFTPYGRPRQVPPHCIISTLPERSTADTLDLPLVPEYQPFVSSMPRRRSTEKGKVDVPFVRSDP